MNITYNLNMSINVRNKDGKKTWLKKIYDKETVTLSSLEALREYLFEKRNKALEMLPAIEEDLRGSYNFPKNFRVVATYPRVFTSPKGKGDESKDMEFLISYKVVAPNGVVATI